MHIQNPLRSLSGSVGPLLPLARPTPLTFDPGSAGFVTRVIDSLCEGCVGVNPVNPDFSWLLSPARKPTIPGIWSCCNHGWLLYYCAVQTKRQYLLILQVSRYCILALQSSIDRQTILLSFKVGRYSSVTWFSISVYIGYVPYNFPIYRPLKHVIAVQKVVCATHLGEKCNTLLASDDKIIIVHYMLHYMLTYIYQLHTVVKFQANWSIIHRVN